MEISSPLRSLPAFSPLPESDLEPKPPVQNKLKAPPETGLRRLEKSKNWDISGRTGGSWDIVAGTDFQSNLVLANALLRQINNSTGSAAAVVNTLNNTAGFLLVDVPRGLEDLLRTAGGPSFEEMAVAARAASPGMPLDDLACYGLARLAGLSHRIRPRLLPAKLKLEPKAMEHIQKRHFQGWPKRLPKSLFFPNVDLQSLLKNAAKAPRATQRGGNYERVVQTANFIGIDRRSLQATSTYSVITDRMERLITMFPGRP